ncbi:MAG: hypothetical protein HYZ47_00690 [Simkania negevensis]|nr:hypothetical protein [Simkania negevensis]
MELVIASKNLHKIREIKAILKPYFPFDFLSLSDFPEYEPPPEKSSSFEENAFFKATSAAKFLKRWCLGEDSGLVIPALQNNPGVTSARYAGEGASPLFIKYDENKTFAELDQETKNKISHRRKALDKLFPMLELLSQKR